MSLQRKPELTVGIATRDRVDDAVRCVESLRLLAPLDFEVILVDDGSKQAVEPVLTDRLSDGFPGHICVHRYEQPRGYLAARNEISRKAGADYILTLDDDAYVLERDGIVEALKAMRSDPQLGAIGFPQYENAHRKHCNQPAQRDYPCYMTHFYGYGNIVRREAMLNVGGYREIFEFYHEESDFCKRLLDAGYKCVFWPAARIVHTQSPVGRDNRDLVRLRYGVRNRCFDAMYNEPLPLMVVSVCSCIWQFKKGERMIRARHGFVETGGVGWLLNEIRRNLRRILAERRPLRISVFWRWRWLKLRFPKYQVRPEV